MMLTVLSLWQSHCKFNHFIWWIYRTMPRS